MQYNILVLGPMEHREGETIVRPSSTTRIGKTLSQMSDALANGGERPFRIMTPDEGPPGVIVQKVLDLIEEADIIVIDLSGARPNVTYEAAVIHALGIPHIILTEDQSVPFYFHGVNVILGFSLESDFNPDGPLPSHRELFQLCRRFLNDADFRHAMAGNILTAHFDDLPLVDLSGAAGMAASYFTNAVRRFVRPGGFTDAARQCAILQPKSGLIKTTTIKKAHVKSLIAIHPPSDLKQPYSADWKTVQDTLKIRNVDLVNVTIKAEDPYDLRDYGGWFHRKGLQNGVTVCIEVPTIVYPMTESPRLVRLRSRRNIPERQRVIIQQVEQRRRQQMLHSFRSNLMWHIEQLEGRNEAGFHYVKLDELPQKLEDLGIS